MNNVDYFINNVILYNRKLVSSTDNYTNLIIFNRDFIELSKISMEINKYYLVFRSLIPDNQWQEPHLFTGLNKSINDLTSYLERNQIGNTNNRNFDYFQSMQLLNEYLRHIEGFDKFLQKYNNR